MFVIDPEIIREMPLDNNMLSGHLEQRERGRKRAEAVRKGGVEGFQKQAFQFTSL